MWIRSHTHPHPSEAELAALRMLRDYGNAGRAYVHTPTLTHLHWACVHTSIHTYTPAPQMRMSAAEAAARRGERDVERLTKQLEACKGEDYAATAARLSSEDAARYEGNKRGRTAATAS